MLTVVYLAVLSANIQHIPTDSDQAKRYGGLGEAVPDSERRPISAHSVALSLGIPYETARRYIGRLIAEAGPERRLDELIEKAGAEGLDEDEKRELRELQARVRATPRPVR